MKFKNLKISLDNVFIKPSQYFIRASNVLKNVNFFRKKTFFFSKLKKTLIKLTNQETSYSNTPQQNSKWEQRGKERWKEEVKEKEGSRKTVEVYEVKYREGKSKEKIKGK